MSWQAYVDQSMLGTGKIARGAILGQKGGVWAISSGYTLSKPEQDFLVKVAFTQPGEAQGRGVTLAGTKYMCLQADEQEIMGRKGEKGCVVMKTNQAILVAEYDPPVLAGDANVALASVAKYLREQSY